MTFSEIVADIKTRLNLTSTDATTRIGLAVNRLYKSITSSIGLNVTRRTQVQANCSIGIQTLSFTGIEKVIAVIDKSSGSDRHLDEQSVDELKVNGVAGDTPTAFAVYRMNANTVQILLNVIPQTALTLYADGYVQAPTLSGSQEPAFPESFHDILTEGVMYDELRKLEKADLAKMAKATYEQRVSDLRMFIAKSAFQDIYRGKTAGRGPTGLTAAGGGSSAPNGASSYTQTGLITFDRSSAAPNDEPFAVAAGANKVTNLDADLLDGENGSAYHNATNLNAGTLPDARFPATLPAASGVNLTALNATQLASGAVPVARLTNGVTTCVSTSSVGAQNNWAPGLVGNTFLIWSGASALAVTGFAAGVVGQLLIFRNATAAQVATFAHASGSSSVGNRLANAASSAPTPVAPGGYVAYIYDGTTWEMVSHDQGAWITPAFAAGDYTASSGNWTVDAGDVISARYHLKGKTLKLTYSISTTDVSATPQNLQRIIPGGFTAAAFEQTGAAGYVDAGGARSAGFWIVPASNTSFVFQKVDASNWSLTAADNTYVFGSAEIEVV